MKTRFFVFAAVVAGVPLAVACSSGPGVGDEGDAGTSPTSTTYPTGQPGPSGTTTGYPTPTSTPTSVPPSQCADPGICGPGLAWNYGVCKCEPVGNPPPPEGCDAGELIDCPANYQFNPYSCDCEPIHPTSCFDAGGTYCAPGWQFNPYSCTCEPTVYGCDAGELPACPPGTQWNSTECACTQTGCNIPGFGYCPAGQDCTLSYCWNGQPISCYCDYNGNSECNGGCPPEPIWDAGADVYEFDATPPPPYDAGAACYIPGYGNCAPNTTCQVGVCPDGFTPVSCYCEDGEAYCNGACNGQSVDAGAFPLR